MGGTFVTLRDLYIYIATGLRDDANEEETELVDHLRTALLWFGAVLVIYMDVQSSEDNKFHVLPDLDLKLAKSLIRDF